MSITRDEIARLCAGHDRFMAEHHDWMARRQAALAPLAQKSDPEGLLYRVHDDGAPAPSPEPVLEPSEDHDLLGHAVNVFAEAVQSRFDDDNRILTALQRENIELRAKLDVVLQILRVDPSTKTGEIVDLPNWRRSDAA